MSGLSCLAPLSPRSLSSSLVIRSLLKTLSQARLEFCPSKSFRKSCLISREYRPTDCVLFDWSEVKKFDPHSGTMMMSKIDPKPRWKSPEYFSKDGDGATKLDFICDIWSLGCLAFYLVSGKHLFNDDDFNPVDATLRSRLETIIDDKISDIPDPQIQIVLKQMLASDPQERADYDTLLSCAWLASSPFFPPVLTNPLGEEHSPLDKERH